MSKKSQPRGGDDTDLFGNVQDLRRRLQQTERTLSTLNDFSDSFPTTPEKARVVPALKLEDLSAGIPNVYSAQHSARSDASGHASQKLSTRQRPATYGRGHQQQQHSVQFSANPQISGNSDRGVAVTETLEHGSRFANNPTMTQRSLPSGMDSSLEQLSFGSRTDHDITVLRKKIHTLREENAQLVTQNHKMLNQLEDLGFDRQKMRGESEALRKELSKKQEKLTELEEQMLCLQSENDAQEKALRDSEDRYEDYQRELGDIDGVLNEYKTQVQEMEEQLNENTAVMKIVEHERDKTLAAAEDIQKAYEDFQRKTRDKIRKFEANEDHYQEKVQYIVQEREQLLKESETYTNKIKDLMEQIRLYQEENRIEKETREETEQHNVQLRGDMALYQQRYAQLEQSLRFQENLQRENHDLKASLSDYKSKLEDCQVQIGESHAELMRLEEVARKWQDKGAMPGSVKKTPMKSTDLDGSYLETLEQTAKDAEIEELRSQLDLKEDELNQLKCALDKMKDITSHGSAESHKKELSQVQDKIKQGEERIEELESLLLRLEEERTTNQRQISKLEEQISDFQINTASMDSKLTHRNAQVSDMQQELSEKIQETTTLEREVRKKTSQISSLERQLDHKVTEVSEQVSKVSDLEDELQTKQIQLQQIKKSLEEKSGELLKVNSMTQKLKSVHVEQCQELEKQIELLEQRFQEKESHLKEKSKKIKSLETEVATRDEALTDAITKAQMEIQRRSHQNDTTLQAFEKKAQDATNRVKQLDSALVMCKEELNVYIEQYQETKAKHELELADKEQQIDRLKHELLKSKETQRQYEKQVIELESNLSQRLDMVQQSTSRISELEDTQAAMERQICDLEQQLHLERSRVDTEKLSVQTEVKGIEKKLQQACLELEQKQQEIQRLHNKISDIESSRNDQLEDLAELERQLGQEKTDSDSRQVQIETMRKEIRQLQNQLKQKDELVEDTKDACRRHKELTEDKVQEISTISAELRQLKLELQTMANQYAESQQEVDALNMEVKDKKKTLEDYRMTIRRREDELRSKEQEMETLERALEDRNWELQQRAAQLTHIDMEVRQHKTDLDQNVIRLEGQLKTAKLENTQKDKQLADLDDRLQETQEQVREKTLQLQQSEQNNRKHKLEIETQATSSQDMEMQVYTLRHRLESSISENTELGQELKNAREEIQKIHYELTESRRELSASKREQSKWKKQYDENENKIKDYEGRVKTLNSELTHSKAQEVELETQTESEMRKLIKEVDAMRERHTTEIKDLAAGLSASKQSEEQLEIQVQELKKRENQLEGQLDHSQKESVSIATQLLAAKKLIDELQNNMTAKESEIARLEGRISGLERTSMNWSTQLPQYNIEQPATQNYVQSQQGGNITSVNSEKSPARVQPNISKGYSVASYSNASEAQHIETSTSLMSKTAHRKQSTLASDNTNQDLIDLNPTLDAMEQLKQSLLESNHNRSNHLSLQGSLQLNNVNQREAITQDDSIVSLLNRMQMHEQHVQDVLEGRLSNSLSGGINQIGTLNESALQRQENIAEASASLKNAQYGVSSQQLVGKATAGPGNSFMSSGRGTLMGSDGLSDNDLADYLAQDPNSFQAMFRRLKDSYNSQEQSTHVVSSSRNNESDIVPQQIPTKDILDSSKVPSNQAGAFLNHGQQPLPDLSLISSISESESVAMQKKKTKSALANVGIQQFTSSPKTSSKTAKKTVRISTAPPQVKASNSRTNTSKIASNKLSKKQGGGSNNKSGSSSLFGGTSKKSNKQSTSGFNASDDKPSRFSHLLAKGFADIEAAAHPNRKATKQSPAETRHSPNISTAISHYTAEDYNQSHHDGSFINEDVLATSHDSQPDARDISPLLSVGSSVEELLAKQIVQKDELGYNRVTHDLLGSSNTERKTLALRAKDW